MIINIDKHDFSIIWDGVYYKALSNHPDISDWEVKSIIDFITYEKQNNRVTKIESTNKNLLNQLFDEIEKSEKYLDIKKPAFISECTACLHKGCFTDRLCHVASLENAKKIFASGKLLSAAKARNISIGELVGEKRNAAKDPEDFFEYIMFSWGNCQAGDRLVMERKLGRSPTKDDLSVNFTPGIRLYFKYETLKKHDGYTSDGYHALKIRDELVLVDYIDSIVIPEMYRTEIRDLIPNSLQSKVNYLKNDCEDIWEWTKRVYEFVARRDNLVNENTSVSNIKIR